MSDLASVRGYEDGGPCCDDCVWRERDGRVRLFIRCLGCATAAVKMRERRPA